MVMPQTSVCNKDTAVGPDTSAPKTADKDGSWLTLDITENTKLE